MSKKDYVAIARAFNVTLKNTSNEFAKYGVYMAIGAVIQVMEDDNSRFDKSRFLQAVNKDLGK